MCDKFAAMGAIMLIPSQFGSLLFDESESDLPWKDLLPVNHQAWVLSNVVAPIPADQAMRDVWRHMQMFSLEKS